MIRTPAQFYGARFFLGAAEAGFFPGILVYLTHWFRHEDRARAGALFMSAIPIANVLGSPLAGWLLGVRWFGIPGWRWLFILEGIPAVLLGIMTLLYLTDWPRQAKWLPGDEQEWIDRELQREKAAKSATGSWSVRRALGQRDVIVLALVYFLALIGLYGFNFWFPTILKRATGLPNLTVTLIAASAIFVWHFSHDLEWLGLRPHRRAPLAYGRDSRGVRNLHGCFSGCERQRLGRPRIPDSVRGLHNGLHAQFLVVAHGFPKRIRRCGVHWPDQLRWKSGRIRRPLFCGEIEYSHRIVPIQHDFHDRCSASVRWIGIDAAGQTHIGAANAGTARISARHGTVYNNFSF